MFAIRLFFVGEGVSGVESFRYGCLVDTEFLLGCHKLSSEVCPCLCGCWILAPIVDSNVELSDVCNNIEGNAGDVLVIYDVKVGFGIGNAVVNFLEEDGNGHLWVLFCAH